MSKAGMLLTVLFLGFASLPSHAVETNTADIFEIKSRLEAIISKKIRRSLETRLHPDDFTVSVNLKLNRDEAAPVAGRKPASDESPQFLPGLPGYVSAKTIMNLYEKELLEDGKDAKRGPTDLEILKTYRMAGASVFVGLNREFSSEYATQLQKWLEERLKNEFGKGSTAEVNQVAQRPPPIQQDVTLSDRLEKFQWPLLALLFSLLTFAAVVIYQWFMARLKKAEHKHKAMLKQMDLEKDRELEEARKSSLTRDMELDRHNRARAEFEKNKFEIQKRLTASLKNFPDATAAVTALLTYEDGGKKVAALLDSTFAVEGAQAITFSIPDVFFKLDIPEVQKREIQKSFSEYQSLSDEEKLKVLESCFWTMAAIGVLSDYQDRRMFQYLRRIPTKSLNGVLKNISPDEQLVAVLHLPEEYQRSYMAQLPDSEKFDLIQSTFEKDTVSWDELQEMNNKVQSTYRNAEKAFAVVDGAIDLIKALRAADEIKILSRMNQVNGEVADTIKGSFLSLAFIDQWSPEAIKSFVEGVQTADLAALIHALPNCRQKVFASVSDMVARMLEDDIQINGPNMTTATVDLALETMREHMRSLEKNGILNVSSVFQKTVNPTSEVRLAVA